MLEHDFEPVPGLPEALPSGERVLWQGQSGFASLARGTFHVRKLTAYFSALLGLNLVLNLRDGVPVTDSMVSTLGYALLAATAIGVMLLYASRFSRATLFSVTNRRIIIRSGIAVPVTMNLPFSRIDAVDLRSHTDGSGDIAICPRAGSRVSYLLLWPLVKPWRLIHVRPVLRAVPDAVEVASLLARAIAADAVAAKEQQQRFDAQPVSSQDDAAPANDAGETGRRWLAYPTAPLAAASSLVVLTLVAVSWLQLSGNGAAPSTESLSAVSAIELFFADLDDGSVQVIDAHNGEVLDVLAPGSNGFLRSTMRTFVRERNAVREGAEQPFALLRTDTGRLILKDDVTGRAVDLWAFGETNANAFARFLPASNQQALNMAPAAATTAVALTSLEKEQ